MSAINLSGVGFTANMTVKLLLEESLRLLTDQDGTTKNRRIGCQNHTRMHTVVAFVPHAHDKMNKYMNTTQDHRGQAWKYIYIHTYIHIYIYMWLGTTFSRINLKIHVKFTLLKIHFRKDHQSREKKHLVDWKTD